jgi:hypothetical protein
MKLSEVRIVSYCSFHEGKKIHATDNCSLCGDGICEEHISAIGVPRRKEIERLRSLAHVPLPDNMSFRLAPFCPTCAQESICEATRSILERGFTTNARGRLVSWSA